MTNFQRFAAIIMISLALVACSDGGSATTESATASKSVASSGERFPFMGQAELDEYLKANQGTPTMLMFWATWCPSCKQALPDLEKLAQSHGDKVNIIALSVDERKAALDTFYKDKEPGLPVYHSDQALAARFDVTAIPTMVFFNKSGEPVFSRPGAFPYDMLTALADKLVAE